MANGKNKKKKFLLGRRIEFEFNFLSSCGVFLIKFFKLFTKNCVFQKNVLYYFIINAIMIAFKERVMNSMLLSLWTKFRQWVSVTWSQTTFYIVLGVLLVSALILFVAFFKEASKGKKIPWGTLVIVLILLGIMALLATVRFTN